MYHLGVASPGFKVCPACGRPNALQESSCTGCGHAFQTQFANPGFAGPGPTQSFQGMPYANYPPPARIQIDDQKWLIALLLCIFLGHLGIHRFYMGYMNIGIAMLLLSVVGWLTSCILIGFIPLAIVWIWSIVDLIQICTNGLPMADGTPLR
jgi:TM2 domain-containing membrane protein YozV